MPNYRIELRPAARKSLHRLPAEEQRALRPKIDALAVNPFPRGSKQLTGTEFHRVRVGDYRIIYQVHGAVLVVLVVKIGHRREVYRGL